MNKTFLKDWFLSKIKKVDVSEEEVENALDKISKNLPKNIIANMINNNGITVSNNMPTGPTGSPGPVGVPGMYGISQSYAPILRLIAKEDEIIDNFAEYESFKMFHGKCSVLYLVKNNLIGYNQPQVEFTDKKKNIILLKIDSEKIKKLKVGECYIIKKSKEFVEEIIYNTSKKEKET